MTIIDWRELLADADMSNFPNHISISGDRYDQGELDENYREYRRRWVERPGRCEPGDFPLHLDVEATNRCNLRCKMCFVDFGVDKGGFIDVDLFRKVADEGAEKGLCSIKFNYRGEPTLHPRLVEMVAYAKKRGILETQFNTNATLLTEDLSRRLIEAGLDKIIVSIDGMSPESYNAIRVGADYHKVVANVKRFAALREKLGAKRPFLRVQMVCLRENRDEVPAYIAHWKPIADQIGLLRYRNIPKDVGADASAMRISEHPGVARPCHQIFQRLVVGGDGLVTMCCGDSRRKLILGDAANTELAAIWKGEALSRVRALHRAGRSSELAPCRSCEIHMHAHGREWEWLFGEGYERPASTSIDRLASGDYPLEKA